MVLQTAEDMYKATLYGVKKESTSTIKPSAWNILINTAYEEWFREKTNLYEFNEKRIEDLKNFIILIELNPTSTNVFTMPTNIFRVMKRQFKINYINNVCGLTGISDWLDAEIQRDDIKTSSFRKPRDNKLYYKVYADKVELLTGTSSTANKMMLKYLKQPTSISYISTTSQTIGELSKNNLREIVDIAVRIYLERAKDERYQSYLNEEAIRVQSK